LFGTVDKKVINQYNDLTPEFYHEYLSGVVRILSDSSYYPDRYEIYGVGEDIHIGKNFIKILEFPDIWELKRAGKWTAFVK